MQLLLLEEGLSSVGMQIEDVGEYNTIERRVSMSSLDHTARKTACQSCLSSWYQAKDRSPSTWDSHSSRRSVARDTKCSIIPIHQREKLNTS